MATTETAKTREQLDDEVLEKFIALARADERTADTVEKFGPMFGTVAGMLGMDVGPERPAGASRQFLDILDACSQNLELAYNSVVSSDE